MEKRKNCNYPFHGYRCEASRSETECECKYCVYHQEYPKSL